MVVLTWNLDELYTLNAYYSFLDFWMTHFEFDNVIYFGLDDSASCYSMDDIGLP